MPRANDILFFLCLNDRGGAEISMTRLAQGLADQGRHVTLAVYGQHPDLGRELGFTGEIIDLKRIRTWTAIRPLHRLLCSGRFSHVLTALTHTNIAAILAAVFVRHPLRVVVTEHSIDGVEAYHASPWFAFAIRAAYTRTSALVGVSQTLAQHWQSLLPSSVSVTSIYNPVVKDGERIRTLPPHAWLAEKEIPVVMGIGRLMDEKNFSLLIRAFALVAQKRKAHLIILGEGVQRPMLEALALKLGVQDKVLMPGFVSGSQAWLARAALLVCPSKREGFGNVIAEALSNGVPVVACDCPCGPAEILGRGRYGRLVPVNDADVMAQAIIETLDAEPDRELLRERAQAFTVSRCIDGYAALVDTLPSTERS